jgi:hypothetical protein
MAQPSGERTGSLAAFSCNAIRVSMLDDDASRNERLRERAKQIAPVRTPAEERQVH